MDEGKFINISDNEKQYCHIYFDNSNEEENRNYLKKNEKVSIIKIIIDYLKKINLSNFNTENITDMSDMFFWM